ncbi:phage baseplate assembly protein V [Longimicrobium terrae]|uniref:Uncharacterized protein involved in type VI secretion and phage assembly n=1 Tax=Longimicrobium terrae TaxID=1639882 RepID=A0A841H2K4_9BACT|nr:phage baseplate assembly protein V [Longimicrobium terrae]MBB4637824.1 uncharacterized protein involved in type VI secretion and phage assembly [Longimicrobium terrae]MBB6072321.1 uncharacterized protein involved in type VI secretion and phage assembly [Longimicrobium terrae]NNC31240.1 hypothetical protein [Longimicrobium terrae]
MSARLEVELGGVRLAGSRVERLQVVDSVTTPAACELVFFRDAGAMGELDALAAALFGGSSSGASSSDGGSSASGGSASGGSADGGSAGGSGPSGFGVRAEELLDAPVRVTITDPAGTHEIFRGELVSVREEHLANAASRFVVSAKSLSHRWDRHRDTKYYPNSTLADVVRALGAKLGGSAPAGGAQLNYVQYDESAWSFLARLADEHGLLMLSAEDGIELRGGFKDTSHPLSWGVDLLSLTSHAQPVNAGMKGALYQSSEKRDHRFHGVRKSPETLGGAASLLAAVERGSTKAIGGGDPGVLAFTSRTPTLADARAALQRESARALGSGVWVEGRSTRAALNAGERIEVGEGQTWRLPTTGAFGLVEVTHRWDGQQYENAFRATPFAAYRAREAPSPSPIPGVVTAMVVANDDSSGMGRVRVRYPWMDGGERSGWVRTASMYAGNSRGVGFLPEVGDEVAVGFEQGDAERPLVLGSLWNGGDKAGHAPGTKQIQTMAGNTIRLADANGAETVELYSAGGAARLALANGGTPTVTVVVKGDMVIEAANEIVLKADRLVQNVRGDATKQISGALTHTVRGAAVVDAQTVDVQAATAGATIQSTAGNLTLQAGGTLTTNGVAAQIQAPGHVPQRVSPQRAKPPASAQQGRAVPKPAPPRTSGDARTPGGPGKHAAAPTAKNTPCMAALVAAAPERLRANAQTSIPLLLDEAKAAGYSRDQAAYLLATAQHESGFGRTMTELRPHKNYEGREDLGNIHKGDGLKYEGRGFVQITGRTNYTDWGRRLGLDLVGHPELATVPETAAKIAVQGMKKGTFTGAKISRYINDQKTDFVNARRVINGTDKADLIAGYAEKYKTALGSCDDWK